MVLVALRVCNDRDMVFATTHVLATHGGDTHIENLRAIQATLTLMRASCLVV